MRRHSENPNHGAPSPPETGEFRATKKVRHREEDTSTSSEYRDRLLAGSEQAATPEDLGKGKGVHITPGDVLIDMSQPIPAINLSTGLKERLAQNMKLSIVVNVLGRTIGYTLLCTKLRDLWDMRGAKVVDMGGGYFLVQFATDMAYQEAILEGPWTLLGSYLQVQTWTTTFRVHHPASLNTTVWIRISNLPLHLYPLEVISAIGAAVGKVVRVDYNTSGMQRGKFARLAVTIDLTKPLVSKFTIDGEEFKVEYENLQELCFHCGMYGHLREVCVHRPKVAEVEEAGGSSGSMEASTEVYGSWMIVEKKRRSQGRRRGDSGGENNGEATGGSRFDVLREEEENNGAQHFHEHIFQESPRVNGVDDARGKRKKEKRVLNGVNPDMFKESANSRNSMPTKATFGELFEYTRKTRLEERPISQATSLDPCTHVAVRMEEIKSGECEQVDVGKEEQRQVGFGGSDILMREDAHATGRPPDETRDDRMAIELHGNCANNTGGMMEEHPMREGDLA